MDRNAIRQALWALVSDAAAFRTNGLRLKYWSDVPPEEMPAIFLRSGKEVWHDRPTGLPAKVTLEAEVWIYTQVTEDTVDPAVDLDALCDAVIGALAPPIWAGNMQTLGGIAGVVHCWVEGDLAKDYGDLDGQAKAVIPVRILATQ